MIRINRALDARLVALRKDGDKGFTLIELLVVVIIIGILAAIAIPVYLGIQNNAKNAAIQSDLTNAKTAIVGYYTQNANVTTTPGLNATDLGQFGFSTSTGVTLTYVTSPVGSGTNFCIKGVRTGSTTDLYSISANGGVASNGTCA